MCAMYFFSSRRRHTRYWRDWSSDVCSSDLVGNAGGVIERCDAPNRFAATWEFGGMMSWLGVTLTPAEDGTTLELVHESARSEERRVGKECRSWWSPDH